MGGKGVNFHLVLSAFFLIVGSGCEKSFHEQTPADWIFEDVMKEFLHLLHGVLGFMFDHQLKSALSQAPSSSWSGGP